MKSRCSVEGCESPVNAKGLCPKHYGRMKNHGTVDILNPRRKRNMTASELRHWILDTAVPNGDCLDLHTTKQKGGYPAVSWRNRPVVASRLMFILNGVELTSADFVCHTRDRPICVNPDHLYVGTAQSNVADRVARSRSSRGEDRPGAKLTETRVREIRDLKETGLTYRAIAGLCGVSSSRVSDTINEKTWKHVA